MNRKQVSAVSDEEIVSIMKDWQELETKAIGSAEALIGKTDNPLVRTIMGIIVHDSEKHKLVQKMVIDSLTKKAIHISPDELNELAEGLHRHVDAEEELLKHAQRALDKCSLVSTHFLLSYLIADEQKHHSLLTGLRDLREASIPTSASARL